MTFNTYGNKEYHLVGHPKGRFDGRRDQNYLAGHGKGGLGGRRG